MASIYLVEDDQRIRSALVAALADRGHLVDASSTGLGALGPLLERAPDVVVLDLGLPDIDGGDLLRMIRGVSQVPVIIATARDDEREIVKLLDAGADDYLVKPFSVDQLEARVRAVLRRGTPTAASEQLVVGGLRIDVDARTVLLDAAPVELTRLEFELLVHLARKRRSGGRSRRAARRGVASAVRRQRQDDRRARVVVATQARRERRRPEVPPHGARGVGVRLIDPTA